MTGIHARGWGSGPAIALMTLLAVALAGCSTPPAAPGETPQPATFGTPTPTPPSRPATAAPAAEPEQPPKQFEASAQCWMKYDKTGGSLEAKAKLVNKCIDDKMKGVAPAKH